MDSGMQPQILNFSPAMVSLSMYLTLYCILKEQQVNMPSMQVAGQLLCGCMTCT